MIQGTTFDGKLHPASIRALDPQPAPEKLKPSEVERAFQLPPGTLSRSPEEIDAALRKNAPPRPPVAHAPRTVHEWLASLDWLSWCIAYPSYKLGRLAHLGLNWSTRISSFIRAHACGLVSPRTQLSRMKICSACPHVKETRRPKWRKSRKHCGVSGCGCGDTYYSAMQVKTWLSNEECPRGHWGAGIVARIVRRLKGKTDGSS